jgi:two-component system NtrC family sensor kinase
LVGKALDMVARQAAFQNIRFEQDIQDDLPLLDVDPVRIQQVLVNLIINAQQAMEEGGEIKVGARRTEDEGRVEFYVQDEGTGIPLEIRSRIFEPFYSTKGGKTDGLGLAVSLGIVQQHGGSIEVESEPGGGTMFRIMLPIGRGGESEEQGES